MTASTSEKGEGGDQRSEDPGTSPPNMPTVRKISGSTTASRSGLICAPAGLAAD